MSSDYPEVFGVGPSFTEYVAKVDYDKVAVRVAELETAIVKWAVWRRQGLPKVEADIQPFLDTYEERRAVVVELERIAQEIESREAQTGE